MYKDIYTDHQTIEISLMQVLMAGVIVLGTLVLPASYIVHQEQTTARNQPAPYTTAAIQAQRSTTSSASSTGRVAGTATQNSGVVIRIPLTNSEIRFQSESQVLIAAGSAVIVIAIGLGAYLFLTPRSLAINQNNYDPNRQA